MLIFMEGGKPEEPEKNPRGKGENQQTTKPTFSNRAKVRTHDPLAPQRWASVLPQRHPCHPHNKCHHNK
jgi:hypothetical protein